MLKDTLWSAGFFYFQQLERCHGVLSACQGLPADPTENTVHQKGAYIPKADGPARPIGIPTIEDKVLQRAVTIALGAVHEQDFLTCSYGFRPGRSCHQALEALWRGIMGMRGGYVYVVDIGKFFDTLDHGHLRGFLDLRVRDGVIRRVIDKWLKAGVLEAGQLAYPDAGTPQGGAISPLLAKIYSYCVIKYCV